MADRQDVPLAGLGATGCTLVVGAYCSNVRRKHSRGGNKATLPQEFSEPLPLAGVSFCQSSAFGGICKRNQAKLGIIRGLTPAEFSAASRLDY